MTEKQYPELPKVGPIGYASVVDIDRYAAQLDIGPHLPGVRDIALWTTDQMRAYVDADRAMRAAQAAPASQDAATGLKDGDIAALVNRLRDIAIEYSDTQQLRERIASEIRPRAAGLVGVASQDAEDAARYRLLRCKVAIVGDSFHILNIRPTFVAPDPAVELDAVLDAAMAGETK